MSFLSSTGSGGGEGTLLTMTELNSSLSGFSFNNVSGIKNELENSGLTLIATPTFDSMAENMSGTSNINSLGVFNTSEFESGQTLANSSGFSNALDDNPFMIFAGFGPNGYAGICLMAYRNFSTAALRDFFDASNKELFNFVLNEDGSTIEDTSGNTSTIFSDNQSPSSNGFSSTGQFSSDDGCWGFSIGTSGLNGNGGPFLSDNQSNSFGCENPDSGDSEADDFFFGSQTVTGTQDYAFYFCVQNR